MLDPRHLAAWAGVLLPPALRPTFFRELRNVRAFRGDELSEAVGRRGKCVLLAIPNVT